MRGIVTSPLPGGMGGLIGGRLLDERRLPGSLEVDGIGEDECRAGVYAAAGEMVFDFVVRLGGDRVVDLLARGVGVVYKVDAHDHPPRSASGTHRRTVWTAEKI